MPGDANMNDEHAYETLSEALADAGVVVSLAELHGGLCGVMCAGGFAAADRWLDHSLGESRARAERAAGDALRELEHDAWRMLSDAEMAFEPLLPAEDQQLNPQVRALAQWCHGFLSGLGFGGVSLSEEAGQDADAAHALKEITRDFAEISRAGVGEEDEADPEQAGFALAELKEYVRVSVQLVFEHLESWRPGETEGESLH